MAPPKGKGKSNNPAGRPPKVRAMTELLRAAFAQAVPGDEQKRSGNEIMAANIAEAATTGMVRFPDGRILKLSAKDILDLWWKVYGQVDGPPRIDVDITSGDAPINVKGYVSFDPQEWDEDAEAPKDG